MESGLVTPFFALARPWLISGVSGYRGRGNLFTLPFPLKPRGNKKGVPKLKSRGTRQV
jgi:hypothetical protein